MIVEVLYFAEFKEITGNEKEKFEILDSNLAVLLKILFDKYKLRNLIWDEKNQKIHSLISIIINNQAIHEKDPSLINLKDGDTIAFLLPVSGG
ncbi:MAG: MoaD/ThiS family protein [Candidatus Lokiarchaeota archaeon]|nr:MoaD/ThiS family protein [Candidatus Lokiarchaeota archaeon]MCK4479190.1 MoaD/ThiS family protein [Candidatus Lokiarchaeota archaeon]